MTLRFLVNRRSASAPLLFSAITALAACGGGGGGATDPTTDPGIPGPTAQQDNVPQTTTGFRGAATDLLDDWAPGGAPDYTSLATVPSSGSATYEGYVFGDLSNGSVTDSLIGRLTLNANFASEDIGFTGSATGFVDQADEALSGTLSVSGGDFNRDGNAASDATLRGVSLAGTLNDGDGQSLVVGVQLEGDFLGNDADAIGGEAIGRVTAGSETLNFDGGFIAEE